MDKPVSSVELPKPKVIQENYRVVLYVEEPRYIPPSRDHHAEMLNLAGKLMKDAQRHLDGFSESDVAFDVKKVCPHCEYPWHYDALDEESGNGCCDKHIAEWEAAKREFNKG